MKHWNTYFAAMCCTFIKDWIMGIQSSFWFQSGSVWTVYKRAQKNWPSSCQTKKRKWNVPFCFPHPKMQLKVDLVKIFNFIEFSSFPGLPGLAGPNLTRVGPNRILFNPNEGVRILFNPQTWGDHYPCGALASVSVSWMVDLGSLAWGDEDYSVPSRGT